MTTFSLHPRLIEDTVFIADLELCRMVIMNDSNYPWFILVPRRNDIKELYQLTKEDRSQLVSETDEIAKKQINRIKQRNYKFKTDLETAQQDRMEEEWDDNR